MTIYPIVDDHVSPNCVSTYCTNGKPIGSVHCQMCRYNMVKRVIIIGLIPQHKYDVNLKDQNQFQN